MSAGTHLDNLLTPFASFKWIGNSTLTVSTHTEKDSHLSDGLPFHPIRWNWNYDLVLCNHNNLLWMSTIKSIILTLLPASLLCKFIRARLDLSPLARSLASTNVLLNALPNATLSEHPAHSNPSGLRPDTVLSQPHWLSCPVLQLFVTEWLTEAELNAWTNAASLVPEKNNNKNW